MPKNPDESLDETPTERPALTPEGFDFAAFIAGVRPTRRAVTIYARGDLLAQRDALRARIEEASDRGENVKALRADLKAVVEEMTAPGNVIDVVVEGRSNDATNRLSAALKEDGVTDPVDVDLRIVASQVVAPDGVTYELLKHLRAVSEPQYGRIVAAAVDANVNPPGVGPDFSRSPSASHRTRASS